MKNDNKIVDKILIVDTNIDYCKYLQTVLKQRGFIAFIATSYEDAYKVAHDKVADAVLIDYMLPYGATKDFIKNIREDNLLKNTPIIVLTSNDSKTIFLNGFDSGADGVLLKTMDTDMFTARVRAFLRLKRLAEENTRYINMLKQDMEYSSKIQKTILSCGNAKNIKGAEMSSYHYAPNEVTGDCTSIKSLYNDWYAILVADVSGHGMAASMLTILIKSFIDNNVLLDDEPLKPRHFIKQLNSHFISENFDKGFFASVFYAIYNSESGEFIYSSAGAPATLHYKKIEDKVEELESTEGSLIGISEDGEFKENRIILQRNDMIFMFTDGLYEIFNHNGEEYGYDKLKNTFSELTKNNIKTIPRSIIARLKKFSSKKFEDDISAIVIRKLD